MYIPKPTEPNFPLFFRIARSAYALLDGKFGSYFLYNLFLKWQLLNRAGRFAFFEETIFIPLKMPETLFLRDYSLFHGLREINFAHAINDNLGEFELFDCGAYFGQVSMRLSRLCPGLRRITAIEPNSDSCMVLGENLQMMDIPFEIIPMAISSFSGKGKLVFPDGPYVPDSAYLVRDAKGIFDVTTLDAIADKTSRASGDVALKIDVEGQEIEVAHGAKKLISSANRCCLFVELHPEVLRRNNLTAEKLLASFESIRGFRWYLADQPKLELFSSLPVFIQIGKERICDVIGISDRNG